MGASSKERRGRKRPRVKQEPTSSKQSRIEATNNPDNYKNLNPSWHLSSLDLDGPWCPRANLTAVHIWSTLYPRLCCFETMQWREIEGASGSHPVQVSDLEKRARDRLVDIQQDDIDELFSLRIGGKERVWGIRDFNVLKILWWDPHHEVCKSKLKHT